MSEPPLTRSGNPLMLVWAIGTIGVHDAALAWQQLKDPAYIPSADIRRSVEAAEAAAADSTAVQASVGRFIDQFRLRGSTLPEVHRTADDDFGSRRQLWALAIVLVAREQVLASRGEQP